MSEWIDNARISLRANIYYHGRVNSRTIFREDGLRITLGVLLPGEYEFGVHEKEIVTLLKGKAEVCLPG